MHLNYTHMMSSELTPHRVCTQT